MIYYYDSKCKLPSFLTVFCTYLSASKFRNSFLSELLMKKRIINDTCSLHLLIMEAS
jgi:hypothetical protein